jgi:phage terminase large subunit GpA-like protein
MPHCIAPMDDADDPDVGKIVLWFAIREGKTGGVCLNIFGRTVTDDPGNVYSVHPTKDDVDSFSSGDVEPMIEACLEGYFVEKKSRDSGRTLGFKKFKGGWIRIVSAGSLTKFRGKSVKVLFLHELDALNPEAIYKAIGRTTGYGDAIIVEESTGTLAPTIDPVTGVKTYNSQIHKSFDEGSQHRWFSQCQACDHWQIIRYKNFTWPPGRMDRAVWVCEKCDYQHGHKEWRRAAETSDWFPTAGLTEDQIGDILVHQHKAKPKDPTVRSRWKNGFTSLLPVGKGYATKLHEFVAKGEAAKTDITALRVWTQEVAAELWDPELEGEPPPAWRPIFDRREDYGLVVPEWGLVLTAFVDCQLNRLEVGWRAWGRNEQSAGMDHVVLDGHIRDPEVWGKLRYELARKFQHGLGCTIQLSMALIDGGAYAEDVYRFFQILYRNPMPGVNGHVRASKGVGQHGHPIITRKMSTVAKNLKGHYIGTWEAKDRIYERLRMEPVPDDGREGVMRFNKQFSEEYFQQLTAEQVTITYERGVEVRKYVNPKAVRNEALDIEVGNLAALRLHPRNFDAIEAELRAAEAATKKTETGPAPEVARRPRRRGTLLGSLRSGW